MSDEKIPREEYARFARYWNPSNFSADAWADLAVRAGMRYVVFTAKHHDGYALFSTKAGDFHSVAGASKKDFVREVVDAFRSRGIRVGLYYSLLDWHHPDFPHAGDAFHPQREEAQQAPFDLHRFRRYLKTQVYELLTQYGDIDLMWFDFSYPGHGPEFWGGDELVDMARKLQPGILLNSRLEASGEDFGSAMRSVRSKTAGDFINPEMSIPPAAPVDALGRPVVWESCLTIGNRWGYAHDDIYRKTPEQLIKALIDCVSKGGNLLLNVSPDGEGRIPRWQEDILTNMGSWLKTNGRSIYGAGPSSFPKPDWGYLTEDDHYLYAHLLHNPIGPLSLQAPPSAFKGDAVRLSDGKRLKATSPWSTKSFGVFSHWSGGIPDYYTYPLRDASICVYAIQKV